MLDVFSLEKRRLRTKVPLCNKLTGGYGKVEVGLFSQVTSHKLKGNGLRLCQERFRLRIRKNFFIKGVANHWNRLSRAVGESPSLDGFKRHVDVALRTWFGADLAVLS